VDESNIQNLFLLNILVINIYPHLKTIGSGKRIEISHKGNSPSIVTGDFSFGR
jgi:hypothetical protein